MNIGIDSWLLEKIEKVAHKIQRFCGKDCFDLARLLIFAAGFIFVLFFCKFLGPMITLLALTLEMAIFTPRRHRDDFKQIENIKTSTYRALERGCANPYTHRHKSVMSRLASICSIAIVPVAMYLIMGLVLAIFTIFPYEFRILLTWSSLTSMILEWLSTYLRYTTPLPPQKSKLKKALENFVELVSPQPVPSPA